MPAHQPVARLAVFGLRYWDDRPTTGDESALDAYRAADAYRIDDGTVSYHEPVLDSTLTSSDTVERLGRLCGMLAAEISAAGQQGHAMLLTGATCAHAVGVVGGMQAAYGAGARIGIVWLDAHGDFNTPHTTLSGGLYGMPLAVCAGLCLPRWRELGGMLAPIPTDRILLVDARNLDAPEAQLVSAVGLPVAAAAPGRQGAVFHDALADLVERCDLLYLHVDTDILDPAFMPSAHIQEPDGPDLDQTRVLIEATLASGKVCAITIASVRNIPEGGATSVASGVTLIRASLAAWQQHGMGG